jgi:hypothetical protein
VPAPLPTKAGSGSDICSAYIAKTADRASEDLRGVIDLDGSQRTLCALRDNGDIACWGDLSRLPFDGLESEVGESAAAAVLAGRHFAPRVLATVADAVELAVTPRFVCARTRTGEVHCVGDAGRGKAPGRWGGFGPTPRRLVGLTGLTHLSTLPGHPLVCGFVSAAPGPRPEDRSSGRMPERSDPREDPFAALAEALADGQAVCWGDDEALRFLNATWLGRPKRR